MKNIVVIGGGHAAAQFCASLKENLPDAELVLVSEEAHLPYQRPPLSKTFLKDLAAEPAILRAASFYADHGVTLRLGDKVERIDRAARRIVFESGAVADYGCLVLATGTRPRMLPLFAGPHANVFALRTVDDAVLLRERLHQAQRLLVVGGGFIGLEIAATAAQLGKRVTLLEAAPRLLGRSASPEISSYLLERHRAAGIDIRLGTVADRIETVDEGMQGELKGIWAGGEYIEADMAVIGIGAVPNDELARQAGLACDNGVLVDECMRTDDPAVFAIGDCTSFPSSSLHRRIRLESVQNAMDQARCAARTIAGHAEPYTALPWFWSDQGASRIQIAGLWEPHHERVLRGDPAQDRFSVLHFDGELLSSVESINFPADHLAARKLIAAGIRIPRDKAADADIPLKSFG